MSHRTQITLTDGQYATLKREAERTGVSLAELVRRAVSAAYSLAREEDAERVLAATTGRWRGRKIDGADYVERLRPGMKHRLER